MSCKCGGKGTCKCGGKCKRKSSSGSCECKCKTIKSTPSVKAKRR